MVTLPVAPSRSPIVASPTLLAGVALLLAAPAAHAQPHAPPGAAPASGASGSVLAQHWTPRGVQEARDADSGPYGAGAGASLAGYAEANLTADVREGRLGVVAAATGNDDYAFAMTRMVQRVGFQNESRSSEQPIEVFLDGTLAGRRANPYRGGVQAVAQLTFTAYLLGPLGAQVAFTRTVQASASDAADARRDRQAYTWMAPVPVGRHTTYVFEWALSASAINGFTADFANTARLYAPPVAGIAVEGENGFLSKARRPDWASAPTSTVPEPATVTLVAAGVLTIGGALRRRRAATGTA